PLRDRRAREVEHDGVAEAVARLEHRQRAPAVAAVDDVVVGALELAAQRALEAEDLAAQIGIRRRYPQEAALPLPFDVGLITLAAHQQIDDVIRRQRADDVSQLHPGPRRRGDRAEAGDEDAGHGSCWLWRPRSASATTMRRRASRSRPRRLEISTPLG